MRIATRPRLRSLRMCTCSSRERLTASTSNPRLLKAIAWVPTYTAYVYEARPAKPSQPPLINIFRSDESPYVYGLRIRGGLIFAVVLRERPNRNTRIRLMRPTTPPRLMPPRGIPTPRGQKNSRGRIFMPNPGTGIFPVPGSLRHQTWTKGGHGRFASGDQICRPEVPRDFLSLGTSLRQRGWVKGMIERFARAPIRISGAHG